MRKFLISILLSVISLGSFGHNIDSLFTLAPDAVLPLLEHNSRLDLLDLYNCNLTAKVYNDLGGEACLLEKDSVHFYVQTSSASFLQFRLLPKGSDTLFSCIRTVLVPEEQSQLLFMDEQWVPVKVKVPKLPDFKSFWQPSDSLSEDRVESLRLALQPAFHRVKWETAADGTPVLVYAISVKGLVTKDRTDALCCLKPVKYAWRNGKFEIM